MVAAPPRSHRCAPLLAFWQMAQLRAWSRLRGLSLVAGAWLNGKIPLVVCNAFDSSPPSLRDPATGR